MESYHLSHEEVEELPNTVLSVETVQVSVIIKDKDESSLSSLFEKFGAINGKAKGPVRNLYYALAKKSNEDNDFCQKYLGGRPIKISKIIEFSKQDEKDLIKEIILKKNNGRSVRSVIMSMANGDAKTALRYQNKYRNAIKNKPDLISEIIYEINSEGKELLVQTQNQPKHIISDEQFNRLKNEIDGLVQKISSKIKKENEYLKQRVARLENENLKLLSLVYKNQNSSDARKFFSVNNPKEYIH